MSYLKNISKQIIYYGFSSIGARILHFFLLPIHARNLSNIELGYYSEIYSYISIFNILFLFGAEQAFFKFSKLYTKQSNSNKPLYNSNECFTASFIIIIISSVISSIFIIFISSKILYLGQKNFFVILCTISILFIDALAALPMALLRQRNKAKTFASIQLFKILFFIAYNILVLCIFPKVIYANKKIEYLLIGNVLSSFLGLLMVSPIVKSIKIKVDISLIKQMLKYSYPLVIVGILTISTDAFLRVSIKYISKNEELLGLFASCLKLSIIINLFIQAFRYAIEPYIFSISNHFDFKQKKQEIFDIFIIFICIILLVISLNIDVISRILLGAKFSKMVEIIPYAMFSHVIFGIYYYISFWYKIETKTYYSILFSLAYFIISACFIIIFMPLLSYWASIWGQILGRVAMLYLCYFFGKKSIDYQLKKSFFYIIITMTIILTVRALPLNMVYRSLIGTLISVIFTIYIIRKENIIHKFNS